MLGAQWGEGGGSQGLYETLPDWHVFIATLQYVVYMVCVVDGRVVVFPLSHSLQSYEVNLLLTSVLSRLAAFSHPLIDHLFSPDTTHHSVYSILKKVH